MYKAPCGSAAYLPSGNPLYSLGTPVCSHIGENLRTACEKMAEEHCNTVKAVILGGKDKGLPRAVPVKGGIPGLVSLEIGRLGLKSGPGGSWFLENSPVGYWRLLAQEAFLQPNPKGFPSKNGGIWRIPFQGSLGGI